MQKAVIFLLCHSPECDGCHKPPSLLSSLCHAKYEVLLQHHLLTAPYSHLTLEPYSHFTQEPYSHFTLEPYSTLIEEPYSHLTIEPYSPSHLCGFTAQPPIDSRNCNTLRAALHHYITPLHYTPTLHQSITPLNYTPKLHHYIKTIYYSTTTLHR